MLVVGGLSACSGASHDSRVTEHSARVTEAVSNSSFVPDGYGCAWAEEFGGDQGLGQAKSDVDSSSWSFQELTVNGEAQVYTTKQCTQPAYANDWNYCVEDGRLRIQARQESVDCDANDDGIADNPVCAPHYSEGFHGTANYTSGRILSKHKVHFNDGYIEFRVKLPQADRPGPPESGIWPAVWMLGENINQGPPPGNVGWPACGEVDIMEWATMGGASQQGWNAIWLGGDNATNACSAWPEGGSPDCGPCNPGNSAECIGALTNGARYEMTGWAGFDHHSWHTYGLKWENVGNNATDQLTFFIDGAKMGVFKLRADESELKLDQFLLLNLAIGGTLGGAIQITDWPDTFMDVDYIRWYRNGQPDQCGLDAGTPSICSNAADGTACDDGTLCNGHETCRAGTCAAGTAVTCQPPDDCHSTGVCVSSTGACHSAPLADGTPCAGGTCKQGICTTEKDAGADATAPSDAGSAAPSDAGSATPSDAGSAAPSDAGSAAPSDAGSATAEAGAPATSDTRDSGAAGAAGANATGTAGSPDAASAGVSSSDFDSGVGATRATSDGAAGSDAPGFDAGASGSAPPASTDRDAAAPDASPSPPPPETQSACSCRLSSSRSTNPLGGAFCVAGLLLAYSRRRRYSLRR